MRKKDATSMTIKRTISRIIKDIKDLSLAEVDDGIIGNPFFYILVSLQTASALASKQADVEDDLRELLINDDFKAVYREIDKTVNDVCERNKGK